MLLKRGKSPCFFQKTHSQSPQGWSILTSLLPTLRARGTPQWQQARENTACGVLGNLRELIPDVVEFFSVIKCGNELLCHPFLRRKVNKGTSCVARLQHRSSRPTCEVGEMDLSTLLPLASGLVFLFRANRVF